MAGARSGCRSLSEDLEVLAAVVDERLLGSVRAPPVELDDQAMLREVRIDAVAGDMHVDQRDRQAVLAQERKEAILDHRAGRLWLRVLKMRLQQRDRRMGGVAGEDVRELVDGQQVTEPQVVDRASELRRVRDA